MAIVDLTTLAEACYWRDGIGRLLGAGPGLCMRQWTGQTDGRALDVRLTIEGVEIDPSAFVQDFARWCSIKTAARAMVLLDNLARACALAPPQEGTPDYDAAARLIRQVLALDPPAGSVNHRVGPPDPGAPEGCEA